MDTCNQIKNEQKAFFEYTKVPRRFILELRQDFKNADSCCIYTYLVLLSFASTLSRKCVIEKEINKLKNENRLTESLCSQAKEKLSHRNACVCMKLDDICGLLHLDYEGFNNSLIILMKAKLIAFSIFENIVIIDILSKQTKKFNNSFRGKNIYIAAKSQFGFFFVAHEDIACIKDYANTYSPCDIASDMFINLIYNDAEYPVSKENAIVLFNRMTGEYKSSYDKICKKYSKNKSTLYNIFEEFKNKGLFTAVRPEGKKSGTIMTCPKYQQYFDDISKPK